MKSIVKQVRISPRKTNLVAGLVRGKTVTEAENLLKYIPKKAAGVLRKAIISAAANAENNFGQDKKNLAIKHLLVTKGPTYKRSIPGSRGRGYPILKRTSNIRVELGVAEIAIPSKEPKKEQKRPKA